MRKRSGPGGLLKQLTKALLEWAMNAELTQHLGYAKNEPEGRGSENSRNGRSRKQVQGDFGKVEVDVPRYRNGSFDRRFFRSMSGTLGIRRQDHLHVRARAVHAGHPGTLDGDLRR
mgnify:CR=1 FL=1